MFRTLFISFLLIIRFINSYSEKAPIKFGKVDKTELEMITYPLDTNAPAVVLCEYGIWDIINFRFTRIVRYKILNKEGLFYASQVWPGYEKTAIRGKTYNLENGEIVEYKLKNESIFKERVFEDYYRLRVAMPNVKVGSVFEIEFVSPWIPNEWKFQLEIPVKWSELIIPQSQYIDFRKSFYGYIPLDKSESDHWVAKNVPAFKEEPYTNSTENYLTKFTFDILSIHIPGYLYKDYTTDWNAVARRLKESDYFGVVLGPSLYLNSLAKEIENKFSTDFDKMKAAYDAVKVIKWNEVESVWATYNGALGSTFRDKIGNSADINLILVNLLNKLKITAHPIVLSTRSNGMLPFFNASLNRLNYVIAYASIDQKVYMLDATDEFAPYDLLPKRCLNGKGQVINKELAVPIDLKTDKKDKNSLIYDLEISEDLSTLKGNFTSSRSEYGGYNFRKAYKEFNSQEEYIEDYESSYPGTKIKSCVIDNLDSIYSPIKEKYDLEMRNQVNIMENKLIIIPMLIHQQKENPFKTDERKYPVDYAYCEDSYYIIKIKIPEGYKVEELPLPLKMELPDKAGKVIYQIANQNNVLNILYRFSINKEIFTFDEYGSLKEFYNQIIKKQAEPIILTKI
jgi:hypothetical protein